MCRNHGNKVIHDLLMLTFSRPKFMCSIAKGMYYTLIPPSSFYLSIRWCFSTKSISQVKSDRYSPVAKVTKYQFMGSASGNLWFRQTSMTFVYVWITSNLCFCILHLCWLFGGQEVKAVLVVWLFETTLAN